jgi:hypothetical protein
MWVYQQIWVPDDDVEVVGAATVIPGAGFPVKK